MGIFMAPFLKRFENPLEICEHAFPIRLVRPRQSSTLGDRLPRNSRDLSALHGRQLLVQLNLCTFLERGQELDVLVQDIVGTLEGLRQHDILEDMNSIGWNVGLLIELTKCAVQVSFTPDAASLGKSPFGF